MGIALTQEQLNDRTQRLHNWVVALLEIFPTLPKEAQEEIYSFFNIETDGTEAQGTAISTILSPNWMVTDEVARSLVRDPILKLPVDAISTAEPKSPGATRTSAGVLSFIDIGGEGAGPTSCCTVS